MKFLRISLVLLSVGILTAIIGSWQWQKWFATPLHLTSSTFVTIEQGDTAHKIIARWQQQQWLDQPELAIKVWLRLNFEGSHIKKGTYQLTPSMTLPDALALLSSGSEYQFSVAMVEGLTLTQWLDTLSTTPNLRNDLNEQVLNDVLKQWPERLGQPNQLEGLLLADTYHFTANASASEILSRAMHAMVEWLDEAWQERQPLLPYTSPYDALIMASIIEKETAVPSERALIAGVFVNRLDENMRLQTDPTVIYGLGNRFDGNLTRAHLKQKTPYNTYVIKGLPPTPIAMAGRAAIHAALHPETTSALYFVAKGDGSHYFSDTLEQHNQAVKQYQLKQ